MTNAKAASSKSLAPAATSGILWLLGQNIFSRFVVLGSQLALAALIQPSDLGSVGIALSIYSIATVVSSFGLDDVLMQRSHDVRFWFPIATPLLLAIACGSMAVLVVSAPFFSAIFHNNELRWLLPILAIALPLNALSVVPGIVIRQELRFRFLAIYTTVELVALQLLTIALAAAGLGAFSFIIPMPLLAAAKAVAFWLAAKPSAPARIRLRQMRHLLHAGSTVTAQRVCANSIVQGDYVILGLTGTTGTVGLYYFAFRLCVMSVHALAINFQQVLFPILTLLNNDSGRQRQAAIEAAQLLSLMIVPTCFLQAAIAAPTLQLLFGSKWEGAIPFIQILSLGLPFDGTGWIVYAYLSARGEFRRCLLMMAVSALVFFTLAFTGVLVSGAIGLAVAVAVFNFIVPVTISKIAFRSWRVVNSIIAEPALISGAAVGCGYLVATVFPYASRPLVQIAVITTISLITYLLLGRIFMPEAFAQIARRLKAYIYR